MDNNIFNSNIFDITTGRPRVVNSSMKEIGSKVVLPVQMKWNPKKDITTYELALCIRYFLVGHVMSHMIDRTEPHFRHFEIIDPNE